MFHLIRANWTLYHSRIIIYSIGIFGLVWALYYDTSKLGDVPPAIAVSGALFWFFVIALHLIAYSKWQNLISETESHRAIAAPEHQNNFLLFRGSGSVWYVQILDDEIIVGMTMYPYKRKGEISKIQKLESGHGSKGSKHVFMCFHNSNWSRPEKEIGMTISAFPTSTALEIMKVLQTKAINAEASAQYIELMQTGRGL